MTRVQDSREHEGLAGLPPPAHVKGVVAVVAFPGRGEVGQQVVKFSHVQAGQRQKLGGAFPQDQIIHAQIYGCSSRDTTSILSASGLLFVNAAKKLNMGQSLCTN